MSQEELPTFTWLEDRKSADGVPVLAVKFPGTGEVDYALLTPFNPIPLQPGEDPASVDNNIFNGRLENEPTATVTVTGGAPVTGKNFEIMIRSDRMKYTAFKLVDGKTELVLSPFRGGAVCGALPVPDHARK